MANTLQLYFPQLRERQQILDDILSRENLKNIYDTWNEQQQKYFLDICCGARGIKMLYDSFFKEIFDPDVKPERLEELLSLLLDQRVKILKVLPNDSTRIADESSLLIMDIVVQLEDGSIANVECQRIGYKFPGQRAACYSADLLLRQYKRVRGEKGKKFSYKDIKKVYSIIFYEQSPKEFQAFPYESIHRSKQHTDTGVEVELLQEFLFVSLDTMKKIYENNGIRNKLEAWLIFLSDDNPETIIRLIEEYPEFREMYEEVCDLCLNTEKVMDMFSKELLELDRNTVQLMIDEMQDEIDSQKVTIQEKDVTIQEQGAKLQEKDATIQEQGAQLQEKDVTIQEQDAQLQEKDVTIQEQGAQLQEKDAYIAELEAKLAKQ